MKIRIFCSLIALFLSAPSLLDAQNNSKAGDIVKAYYAAFDAGNIAEMEKLLSPDFTATAPFLPGPTPLAAWKEIGAGLKAAFPDMQHPIKDWFADGKKVAVSGMALGTNKGSFMGNPPTNNKVNFPFTAIFELTNDLKIKSLNVQYDQKTMEMQLMAGINPNAKAETNIRSLFAAMDAGQTEKFQEFCAADFMILHPFLPAPQSIAVFQGIIQGQKAGFPDMQHEITDIFVAGNKAAVRGIFKGANTGAMQGNPPTNNKVALPFTVIYDLDAQGKIKHQYVSFDTASFNSQLTAGITESKK
ncbi:MAG: hypothetical protein DYG98_13035 [Haliscomenobacteraceae bacterium CHB4]|nr:hypothetical protein [Saprospiraceae bacterium]MCE7923975.1 hypothetical protein [Haliscomenobacteraceae bacterium CHB4]